MNKPENKETIGPNPTGIRKIRVLIWALVFFALIDIGVRVYFSMPDLAIRNIDRGIGSVPYLLGQMKKHTGRKVVFIGASVMQGYQNVSADRTFTALVEKNLSKTKEYEDVRCYNLSSAGHNFGDHYCLTSEVIRYKPDLIVVAIHFKSFSQHAATSTPIQHPELSAYITRDPKRNELLKRWRISKMDFWLARLDNGARKLSGFYRYHELIPQLISGSADPPAYIILDHYKAAMGLYPGMKAMARLHAPEDRSNDYLWKLLPEQLIVHNHELCSNLDFSDSNINWRTFTDLCELGREKKVNMLFYLTPINRAIVQEQNFFDWNLLRNYKQVVFRQVHGNGLLLADFTNNVDYAFFSDTDHLNMNGHAQISLDMTKEVKKALNKPSGSSRRK